MEDITTITTTYAPFTFEAFGLTGEVIEEDDDTYTVCAHSNDDTPPWLYLALNQSQYPSMLAAFGYLGYVIEHHVLDRYAEQPDGWLREFWYDHPSEWADWHYRQMRAELFGAGFTNTELDEFAGGMSLVRVPISATVDVLIDDQYNAPKWTVGLVDSNTGENIETCTVESTDEVIAVVVEYQAEWGEFPTLIEAVQAAVNRSTLSTTDKARALTHVLAGVLDEEEGAPA